MAIWPWTSIYVFLFKEKWNLIAADMVGQNHNNPVMWTSLLNKTKSELLQGQRHLNHLSVATYPRLTGFCCHGTLLCVWWHTFYGELGPGVVRVIYSTAALPCQQSGIHYHVCYLPAAGSVEAIPTPGAAQPSAAYPAWGEIILMRQLFHEAETWWLWREHNERACCCEGTTNYRLHLQIELRRTKTLWVLY